MSQYKDPYARMMQHPAWVLAVLFFLVVLLAVRIPALKLDASSDSLVLEGDSSLEEYRQVVRTFGATDFLLVTYSPETDLYSQESLHVIASMKDDFQKIEGVKSVVTILDVPLLYSPKVSLANFSEGMKYLADDDIDTHLARREFLQSPVYKQLLTSQSEKTTAIQVSLHADENLNALCARHLKLGTNLFCLFVVCTLL